jgi:putative aldouronate transport system permease protein
LIESRLSRIRRLSIFNIILLLFSLACIIPFILVISISLSKEKDILDFGYKLIPKQLDFTGYKFVFANLEQIINAYKTTAFVSFVGTLLSVLVIALAAYPLSRSSFRYKKQITFYLFFTMLFGGGLVPSYILITRYLKLSDKIWVMIIPGLVNVWYIFLMRTFFQKIPESIFESARIDGANEFKIFWKLVLPLSKPVIATVALFGVLGRWNIWFEALLYIQKENLYTLQFLLQRMLQSMQFLVENMDKMPPGALDIEKVPGETTRMAMVIVAAGPMVIIFPFFQKYFVQGLTVGSVKG